MPAVKRRRDTSDDDLYADGHAAQQGQEETNDLSATVLVLLIKSLNCRCNADKNGTAIVVSCAATERPSVTGESHDAGSVREMIWSASM